MHTFPRKLNSYLFNKFADNTNKDSVSYRLRGKRFSEFLRLLSVSNNDIILDVGGTESTWAGTGYEKNVTLLNLSFEKKLAGFKYVIGDACEMKMFADTSFDIIYSNSVIEHVGKEKQKDFAKEISRVGKRFWVQTPYKHFPIEPHFVFPLFQYLPSFLQKLIATMWPYSHYKMGNTVDEVILGEMEKTNLLNKKELESLFIDAVIMKEKYFGLIKSLIAYKM